MWEFYSKMNFKYHLNLVERKLSTAVGILYKMKAVLPREALLKLYYALVTSETEE